MKPIELESTSSTLVISPETGGGALSQRTNAAQQKSFPGKLRSIQILRGVAAALVVLHHFSQAVEIGMRNGQSSWLISSGFANIGAAGVDIFFVISGFIMFYTTTRDNGLKDAGVFLWKRALRIYPLYWFWSTVLLLLALSKLFPGSHGPPNFDGQVWFLIGSYLLIPVFNGLRFHPFLDQGWTLSFEMLFYCIFALGLAFRLRSSMLSFLSVSFGGLFLAGLLFTQSSGVRYLFCNSLVLEFLLGAFLAKAFLADRFDFLTDARLWAPLCVIGLGCAALASTRLLTTERWYTPDAWRIVLWGAPSALIVLGFVCLGRRLANPILEYLGDASYSTYLAHTFLVGAFRVAVAHFRVLNDLHPDLEIVIGGILTILLTLLGYQFIERPLVSSLRGNWRRGRRLPALAAS